MLQVTCDVIGIQCAMPFFEIQDGRHAFCTLSKFVLENVRNRTKTVLVTPIALNTRNLSKIVVL